MDEQIKVLAVVAGQGSQSHSLRLLKIAAEAAQAENADVEVLVLSDDPLPIFRPDGTYDQEYPRIEAIRAKSRAATAFLLATPEYHGSMSGAMKNFLDFHYREFAGKAFGLIAATGSTRGFSAISHLRASIQYCHGWALPYQAASRMSDFDSAGNITNSELTERLRRLGRDVVEYGRLFYDKFNDDIAAASSAADTTGFGFAGWHADERKRKG